MLPWIRNSWAQGTAQASLVDMNVMRHKKTQTLHKEVSFCFSVILKLKISPCTFSPKHCIDFPLFLQIGCPIENYSSVGGIVVSIAAFQAVDPGSIPGRRSYHSFFLNTNICEQFLFNFGLPLLCYFPQWGVLSFQESCRLTRSCYVLIFPFWFFHFDFSILIRFQRLVDIQHHWISNVFYHARSGCEHDGALKMPTCKSNMAARYDRAIVIWKGVLKQFNKMQFLCDGI